MDWYFSFTSYSIDMPEVLLLEGSVKLLQARWAGLILRGPSAGGQPTGGDLLGCDPVPQRDWAAHGSTRPLQIMRFADPCGSGVAVLTQPDSLQASRLPVIEEC